MEILPIKTPILHPGDDIVALLYKEVRAGDIIVVSSKAVATVENAFVSLRDIPASAEAKELARVTGRSAEFCHAVLRETKRMQGKVVGSAPGAVLTEVRPEGLTSGSILIANAGLDESNAPRETAIGWPKDPVASLERLRSGHTDSALIMTDSCVHPRRSGVTAFALAVTGLDPLQSMKGEKDLFGRALRITTEAIADQLATAANFVMGNAGQAIPAAIIRDHGVALSDWSGWVPGIEPEEDLFQGVL
jgi:coenzyme F420-0:L-glutamate ligase